MRRWRSALAALAVIGAGVVAPTVASAQPSGVSAEDLTGSVNPLSGSLGAGFPTVGAGVPFGFATPGAATTTPAGDDPVNYVGYAYQDPDIRGFAVSHFDGAGIHIGGELPTMATTGDVSSSDPTSFASPFSHASETAQPGYYSVALARYQTTVELTATPHVAVERYTFPATSRANVLLDVTRDNDGVQTGALHVIDERTVTGSVVIPRNGGYTVWFTARFDRPFTSFGTWTGSALSPGSAAAHGAGVGGWVTFDTTSDRTVGVRIGLSGVDAAGATTNLGREAPDGTTFDAVRVRAHDGWNARLHAVEISGGFADQRATFYTNLYRSLLLPTAFDDADGRYLGFDNVIHQVVAGHHHYTDLSLWDTYRTQTPMLALIAPEVAHDVGISLLDDADQNGGVVPRWVYGNRDYGIMGGDSGTPTLATLVTDGALTGADAERAYATLVRQATTLPPVWPRGNLDADLAHGYVPNDVSDIGAALTLEYAVDDASLAWLSRRYGTGADVAEFTRRAGFWRNLMNPDDHFLRPRNADGSWADPTVVGPASTWSPDFSDGWQEGTGWQYLWAVPQDVPGLATAMGGVPTAVDRLDQFFGTTAQSEAVPVVPAVQTQASFYGVYYIGNQFTPANETDLQAPWLYDWLGAPWKTQKVLHASAQVWSAQPNGLPGNDDAGTMSAWYVLTAVGLYQAQPGAPAWELSSPLFDSITINGSKSGRPTLRILAPGAGPTAEYVASAALDAKPLTRAWLTPAQVRSGKVLRFTLQAQTGSTWASAPSDAPPSLSTKELP